MVEREGFSIDPFRQVVVIPTVSDSSLCLCGCRAHSQLRLLFPQFFLLPLIPRKLYHSAAALGGTAVLLSD
jgi:hypothetical protein